MENKKNSAIDLLLVLLLIVCLCGIYFSHRNNSGMVNLNFNTKNTDRLNNNEKPAKYYIDLAKEVFDKGDYNKAIEYWEQSLDAHPYHPEGVYHDIGMSYVLLGRYEEAIEPLKKSMKIDPNINSTYYYLAESYYYLGDIKKAKENYEKVLVKENRSGSTGIIRRTYLQLSHIEGHNGNYEKSYEYQRLAENY